MSHRSGRFSASAARRLRAAAEWPIAKADVVSEPAPPPRAALHHIFHRAGDDVVLGNQHPLQPDRAGLRSIEGQQFRRGQDFHALGIGGQGDQQLPAVARGAAGDDVIRRLGSGDPGHRALEDPAAGGFLRRDGRLFQMLPGRGEMGNSHGGKQLAPAKRGQQSGLEFFVFAAGETLAGSVSLGEDKRGRQAGFGQPEIASREAFGGDIPPAEFFRNHPAQHAGLGEFFKLFRGPNASAVFQILCQLRQAATEAL